MPMTAQAKKRKDIKPRKLFWEQGLEEPNEVSAMDISDRERYMVHKKPSKKDTKPGYEEK